MRRAAGWLHRKIRYELGKLFSDNGLSWEQLLFLFYAGRHSQHLRIHRASIINTRVRIFSWAFAVLVLLWIPIDLLMLPGDVAMPIAGWRLAVAASLLLLGWSVNNRQRSGGALLRFSTLLLVTSLFYLAVQWLSREVLVDELGRVLLGIYFMIPLLIVAGLPVFPLTVLEGVLFGGVAMLILVIGTWLSPLFNLWDLLPLAWILLLVLSVSVAAAAAQLHYMGSSVRSISTDQLTGAFSRASGAEMADLYFRLSVEQGHPFTIGFVDLDHFKRINDDYGHQAGDATLRSAADWLKGYLRRDDLVVRWGGEEFLLLLAGTDIAHLDKPLARITGEWLGVRPDGEPLTASIGLAERIADGAEEWSALVELADRRMYLAKQAGRARVVAEGG